MNLLLDSQKEEHDDVEGSTNMLQEFMSSSDRNFDKTNAALAMAQHYFLEYRTAIMIDTGN